VALPYKVGLGAGAAALVLFVLLAAPAPGWHDGGEMAAAGFHLGVAHPPGAAPLPTLARLASLLPLGPVALRTALVGAATGAAALALFAVLATRLALRLGAEPAAASCAGAAAAALLGTSTPMLAAVTEVEAYGPALLALAAALLAVERRGPAAAPVAGLALGLGGAVHPLARLVCLPPALLAVRRSPTRWRAALALTLAALAGTAATVAVLVSSLGDPPTDWGDPETLARLWDHLTAGRIRRSYAERILSTAWLPLDAAAVGRLVLTEIGAGGLVLASLGTGAGLRRAPGATIALVAVALADLAYAAAINPMGLAESQVGLSFVAATAVLVGLGAAVPGALVAGRRSAAAATALLAAAALAPRADLIERWSAPAWTPSAMVADALSVPPRAAVLCGSDALCGGALYAQYVEGDRPDVLVLPRQHLWDAGLRRARLARHAPDLAPDMAPEALARSLHATRALYWELAEDRDLLVVLDPRETLSLDAPPPLLRVGGAAPAAGAAASRAAGALERWTAGAPAIRPSDRRGLAAVVEAHAVVAAASPGGEGLRVADTLLAAAIELSPSASALVNRSAVAVRRGDVAAARQHLARAIAEWPGSVRALVSSGRLELSLGHDERARQDFERARRLCPDRCGAPLGGLGTIAARAGDDATARALLREALRREPRLHDEAVHLRLLDQVAPVGGRALPSRR
jgi:tetratricopeptide (TPR) repeat protein